MNVGNGEIENTTVGKGGGGGGGGRGRSRFMRKGRTVNFGQNPEFF